MQINVIRNASPQLLNAMLFHGAGEQTQSWISQQYQQARDAMSEAGRSMMDAAAEVSRRMVDPNLMMRARAAIRKLGGVFHPNTILPLVSIEELQTAKPIMQRYIMAMPEIRKLYHRQLCDGYSDSYVDHQPGLVGDAHYDYRRVMDGIVQYEVKEDGEEGWRVSMYPEELEEGDRPLELDEQDAILRAWKLGRMAMKEKIDFTDVLNGKLE